MRIPMPASRTPASFEIAVIFLVPDLCKARIKFSGIPARSDHIHFLLLCYTVLSKTCYDNLYHTRQIHQKE